MTIRTLNTPFFTPSLTVSEAKGYHDLPLSVMAPSRGGWTLVGDVHTIDYSRTPLFRTRLIRSPCYFEGRSNSLGFTLMFSVIYYQLFRTRLFRIPRYFELIVLSPHLKSSPLFRTCQKQSTYIRAQLETYCILFELVLRN